MRAAISCAGTTASSSRGRDRLERPAAWIPVAGERRSHRFGEGPRLAEARGTRADRLIMRVAITGATGLIGHTVAAGLAAAGHELVRLGRGEDADVRID